MKGSVEEVILDFLYRKFPRVNLGALEELASELSQLLEEYGHISHKDHGGNL